jgi:hypothetical protein
MMPWEKTFAEQLRQTLPPLPDSLPPAISIDEQIAEVKREIALRVNVYKQRVAAGKMKPDDAKLHMERMLAVLDTLVRIKQEGGR